MRRLGLIPVMRVGIGFLDNLIIHLRLPLDLLLSMLLVGTALRVVLFRCVRD